MTKIEANHHNPAPSQFEANAQAKTRAFDRIIH